MRISDWSSDVCSSDLNPPRPTAPRHPGQHAWRGSAMSHRPAGVGLRHIPGRAVAYMVAAVALDRKSVVSGKSVSVRVDLGGRRIIQKKNTMRSTYNHRYTPQRDSSLKYLELTI